MRPNLRYFKLFRLQHGIFLLALRSIKACTASFLPQPSPRPSFHRFNPNRLENSRLSSCSRIDATAWYTRASRSSYIRAGSDSSAASPELSLYLSDTGYLSNISHLSYLICAVSESISSLAAPPQPQRPFTPATSHTQLLSYAPSPSPSAASPRHLNLNDTFHPSNISHLSYLSYAPSPSPSAASPRRLNLNDTGYPSNNESTKSILIQIIQQRRLQYFGSHLQAGVIHKLPLAVHQCALVDFQNLKLALLLASVSLWLASLSVKYFIKLLFSPTLTYCSLMLSAISLSFLVYNHIAEIPAFQLVGYGSKQVIKVVAQPLPSMPVPSSSAPEKAAFIADSGETVPSAPIFRPMPMSTYLYSFSNVPVSTS